MRQGWPIGELFCEVSSTQDHVRQLSQRDYVGLPNQHRRWRAGLASDVGISMLEFGKIGDWFSAAIRKCCDAELPNSLPG